jgi:hypothetical protein
MRYVDERSLAGGERTEIDGASVDLQPCSQIKMTT